MGVNVYVQNGYANRYEYLQSLADEFNIDYDDVVVIADTLGSNEDFDGLRMALEDFADGRY